MSKILIGIIIICIAVLIYIISGDDSKRVAVENEVLPAGWFINWNEAKAESIKSGKPLFVVFSGSDWCPPCQKLHKNVFETIEWESFIKTDVVFVYLDYPQKKVLPLEYEVQNEMLAKKYEINSFPTCMVVGPNEEVVQRFYYYFEDPDKFIERLKPALIKKG